MPEGHPPAELAVAFVALNQYLSAEGDSSAALNRLVSLAVESIPACDWAALTVWPSRRPPHSMAVSHAVAAEADELQYRFGDGPCLAAATGGQNITVPDLAAEDRWPSFAAAALAETPVRGVLSFHLADDPSPSALNLYSVRAGAFGAPSIDLGALFAAHASVLVLHAGNIDQNVHLAKALTTSRQIGAAVGILMAVHKVTAEQAFDLLRVASQTLNRKLAAVADEVTETGTLPSHESQRDRRSGGG